MTSMSGIGIVNGTARRGNSQRVVPLSNAKIDMGALKRVSTSPKNGGRPLQRTLSSPGRKTKTQRVEFLENEMANLIADQGGNLKMMFRMFDQDKSGGIDKIELRRSLVDAGVQIAFDEDLDALFALYDENGDGVISKEEFALKFRLDKKEFGKFLRLREAQNEACKSLPLTIVFFIVYVVLILLHEDTENVFGFNTGLKTYFTESATFASETCNDAGNICSYSQSTFEDIASVEDFWGWFENALIPAVASDEHRPTRHGDDNEMLRVSRYSVIVGSALKLEQTRASTVNDLWTNPCNDVYGNECHNSKELSSRPFGKKLCETDAERNVEYSACIDVNDQEMKYYNLTNQAFESRRCLVAPHEDGSTKDGYCLQFETSVPEDELALPYTNSQNMQIQFLSKQIQMLKKREWIDLYTNMVKLKMYIYNGELGVYSSVTITFDFKRGGEIETIYKSNSLVSDPYGGSKAVIFGLDGLWIILVLGVVGNEIKEMVEAYKESERKNPFMKWAEYWDDKWNYLDWSQAILALTVQGMWFGIYFDVLTKVTQPLAKLNDPNATSFERPGPSSLSYDSVFLTLDSAIEQSLVYRILAFVNLFVLMVRFFKAFGGQPKLAVITKTMSMAAVDIAHHMVIMTILLLTFMFAGMFIFGQEVVEWGSFQGALSTTLYIWFTGEVVWDDLLAVNSAMAIIWYLSFVIMMSCIILNLFLAIILNGYDLAKRSMITTELTLWAQITNFLNQAIAKMRGSVSLEYIMEIVCPEEDDEARQERIAREKRGEPKEKITIEKVLQMWKDDDEVQSRMKDSNRDYAFVKSNEYLQELVSDFMIYMKRQRDADEPLQKEIMYKRIRAMEDHFYNIHEKLDATLANGKGAMEYLSSISNSVEKVQRIDGTKEM